jgi:hypothetical protein
MKVLFALYDSDEPTQADFMTRLQMSQAYAKLGSVDVVEVDVAKGHNRSVYSSSVFPSLKKVSSKARPTFIYRENDFLSKVDPEKLMEGNA